MDEVKKAIKMTKDYANKYGQKLNDRQLFLRLISPKVYEYQTVKGQGENAKESMEWQKKIFLAKRLVEKNLSKMAGIEMVGVSGSVAAEGAKKNEDIDLLIVTRKDELWWWRLYVRFYVWSNKIPHRRFGKEERKNEFCFNLWLDSNNLKMPPEKRNLKNAMDLIMMKVIWNKNDTYQRFLRANKWVRKYLATGYRERIRVIRQEDEKISSKRENKFCKKIINRFLFWGQYLYMYSKQKRGPKGVKEGQAFFHKEN